MYDTILECPICYEYYDLEKRTPRMICCGHTICSRCINNLMYFEDSQIFKCPIDKIPILLKKRKASCFPKNLAFLGLIEKINNTEFCQKHMRMLEWVCEDEDLKLCPKCILEEHRGHDIKIIQSNESGPENKNNNDTKKSKANKIISAHDQPEILANAGLYEKVQFIKETFLKLVGLLFAILLVIHPFLDKIS